MYLRRLHVHGFKAFADRQHFEFGPGMTVIVGPNGSGKSNVHDAIRWALGEHATRQIRARKTEDVIFSGSDQRRQMGSAEVTLTLDNSDGWMPIEFSEVTVTRRAHRSGDNEYLINGQRVRLADVLDLFRRAQVGQNSYAMMSQGLVDEVLGLRPRERRELIEEAADVRRHRQQLNLSERRLTETRDNLGRVRLLIREVEPRLRQLERQSRKAERYRELQSQLRDALCVYYEAELRRVHDALAAARATHDQQAQDFAQARSALQRLDARLKQLDATAAERRESLQALQRQERELAEQALRLEQRIALADQRHELLQQRRTDVEAELAAAAAEPGVPDGGGDQLAVLDLRVEEWRTALEREREALQSADEAARDVLREVAEAEAARARLTAELEDATRRVDEHEQRRRERDADLGAARARLEELLDGLRALGVRALDLDRRGVALKEAASAARRRRDENESAMEERLRLLIEARDTLRAAEGRVRQQQERRAVLEELAELAGASAPQALLAGAQAGDDGREPLVGIVGTIGQLIRVPEGLEAAIEAALAEQIAAVVVEREQDAIDAIAFLRDQGAGTATLLPLESVDHNYPVNLFNERGVLGVAARLVRTDQRFRPLIDTLLGRTIVVEDLDGARRMIRRGLGAVVTRDGVLLRPGGAYYGGRGGGGARAFTLRREGERLPEQVEDARRTVEAARARLQDAEARVTVVRDDVTRARDGVDEAEELRRSHEQQLATLRGEQATLSAEMRLARERVAGQLDAEPAAAARRRRDALQRDLDAVAANSGALRDRSGAVIAERDGVAERVTAAAAALAAAEGGQRSEVEQREERNQARRRARERRQLVESQSEQLRREMEDLELSLRESREQAAHERSALALAQAAVDPAHSALTETTDEARELAATRGAAQARLLGAERATLQAESALRERAAEAAETPSEQASVAASLAAAGDETAAPVRGGAEVDTAALRDRISELRGEIRALGPVNVDAVEDLGEEHGRHEFLSKQVADLESAEQELRAAIRDLRKLIRARFDETFGHVNAAFSEYFQRFFGGGAAELRLVAAADEDDDDPGVEITAQPPGKRISSLNVLSGGERALTSVSLLFALLSVNPAPICVLDEVDAALDEANVERFVETLRELCGRSQFIVITHNRATVEAADAIYGVSMGEDSTSRVLSLMLAGLPQAS